MTKIYDLLISSACNTHIILYLYIRLMFHVPKITTSVSKKNWMKPKKLETPTRIYTICFCLVVNGEKSIHLYTNLLSKEKQINKFPWTFFFYTGSSTHLLTKGSDKMSTLLQKPTNDNIRKLKLSNWPWQCTASQKATFSHICILTKKSTAEKCGMSLPMTCLLEVFQKCSNLQWILSSWKSQAVTYDRFPVTTFSEN